LVSQLLLALGLTLAIVLYSRAQLLAGFDTMLEGRANSVLAAIHETDDESGKLFLDRQRLNLPGTDIFEVRDQNNRRIWRSDNWQGPPAAVMASASLRFKFNTGKVLYRGIVMREVPTFEAEDEGASAIKKVTIVYASSTQGVNQRILKIGAFAAGSSLVLLKFAGFFASYSINRGLSPMNELAMEAARVSVRHWTFDPPTNARNTPELTPLIDALELTLAGLRRAFNREREFIADAAHELKTAVAILKSSLQLTACQPHTNGGSLKGLERSLKGCSRLEALVCDTLNLARAEHLADEGHLDDLPCVDLLNTCRQSVAELEPVAEARGIRLRFKSNVEAKIKADPTDLQIIWVNLLQNAIQHSREGSTVYLQVTASDKTTASVAVEDEGEGIPSEQLPHIFERFYRADASRSRTTGGFGLGLSICKAIVSAYGGDIRIASPNGAGTRVCVSLPAIVSANSEKQPRS
jgi:signal transduction histidine kinase